MAAKNEGPSYQDIVRDVRGGKIAPVYCFMGEEDYYIDKLSDFVLEQVLKPEDRDFNYDLLYGAETRANDIINIARQFPMMADRRVVMVREFQSLTDKEALAAYIKNPNPTTVLILCHKHGVLDKRRTLGQEIKKVGVLFESKRLYENQLPGFVNSYMQRNEKTIEPNAVQMLCEHVGSDLTRLSAEMDKLLLAVPLGENRVGVELVEQQTGISKDFNNFELQNALGNKDAYKANQIVNYFDSNPRGFALPATLSVLFNFFTEVMLAFYAPDQSDDGIANFVGKNPWVARQALIPARRNYSGRKVVEILDQIRKTDGKSKGVGGCKTSHGDLLRELIFLILH